MDREVKYMKYVFARIIRNDLRYGIIRSWSNYTLLLAVMLIFFAFFRNHALLIQQIYHFSEKLTYQNYILEFLKGMPVFGVDDVNTKFEIPVEWMFFYLWNACMIAMYPEKEKKTNRRYLILQCRSRILWWFAKCIWCVTENLASILTIVFSIVPFVLMQGHGNGGIAKVTFRYLLGIDFTEINYMWMIGFILQAFLVMCGLSILQAAITLYVGPVVGFLCIACVLIVSAYYVSPYLPGNYLMILRMREFVGAGGVSIVGGIEAGIILSVAGTFIGYTKSKKMDIL